MIVFSSGEGSPGSRAVELTEPNRDGEGGGMLVPEGYPIGLDPHASVVLAGLDFE